MAANIRHIQAYSKDKLYGKALNDAISATPKGCWICVRDMDTLPLTPNWVDLMEEAIETHPRAILFTCATNRVWGRPLDHNTDILHHIKKAKELANTRSYTLIGDVIPAFMWLFRRSLWERIPFDEHPILYPPNRPDSFDTRWTRQIGAGIKMRIDHLYIFHTYRIDKNHRDYKHLMK